MENALLDWRFLNRGIVKPKNKIGILAIDEKAIEQFGRWPFSRKYYGQALRNLKDMGVSWVGFDAVFSEAEKPTIDDVKSYLDPIMQHKGTQEELYGKIKKSMDGMAQFEQVAPGDKDLAEGIKYFQNAIMGYFYFRNPREVEESGRKAIAFEGLDNIQSSQIETMIFPEGRDLSSYDFLNVYGIVPNTPFLRKSGTHNAFFSNEADPDAIIRWVTLVKSVNGHLMPSLSLELAALSSNRTILVEFGSYGIESIDLVNNNDDSDSLKIPIDPLGMGRALINHRGPSETFPHFSLADAYNNTFTDKQKEWLKGSSLLVGMTAIGINDQRPNPFDATLDGVEIHATAADNILSKDLMSRPKSIYSTELLIILLIGLIFSPILVFSRAAYSGLIGFGFILSYYFFDKYYWFDKGI
jgi:adenylate cyclase